MKQSKKHSTFIKAMKPVIASLEKMPSVRTYVFGVIEQKGRDKRVKITQHEGGLHLMVSGGGAVQGLWVYPMNDSSIEQLLAELKQQSLTWKGYTCVFVKDA
jgi:hypothetical protein